jgi:hypothetical protein
VNVKRALVEKHAEGRYYMSHNGQWIEAGSDAHHLSLRVIVSAHRRLPG